MKLEREDFILSRFDLAYQFAVNFCLLRYRDDNYK
jgi:hypothetical protein